MCNSPAFIFLPSPRWSVPEFLSLVSTDLTSAPTASEASPSSLSLSKPPSVLFKPDIYILSLANASREVLPGDSHRERSPQEP